MAVDLLGFGQSPKPVSGYGPYEYADAVISCLRELDIDESALLVGHSMGTLVALALASYHPELVDSVIAIAPPIYASRADGMRHIRSMDVLERLMAFGPVSRLMCRWMCNHRTLAARLVPLIEPSLPVAVARAGVQHTWASYSQCMDALILAGDAPGRLATTTRPVHLILAIDDPVPDLPLLERLRAANDLITLDVWATGGHHLPLTQPAKCVAAIARVLPAAPARTHRPQRDSSGRARMRHGRDMLREVNEHGSRPRLSTKRGLPARVFVIVRSRHERSIPRAPARASSSQQTSAPDAPALTRHLAARVQTPEGEMFAVPGDIEMSVPDQDVDRARQIFDGDHVKRAARMHATALGIDVSTEGHG